VISVARNNLQARLSEAARNHEAASVPPLEAFRWALMFAVALAAIVVALFGFTYWQTASYLTARSDQMVMTQVNCALSPAISASGCRSETMKTHCPTSPRTSTACLMRWKA
jgi:hypothetical protein